MLISTNILRDENLDFDYIVTDNAQGIFESINSSNRSAQKCFNLIGSYGTGKSSFLLAFEQTLRGTKLFFDIPLKKTENSPRFIKLIGKPSSIKTELSKALKLPKNSSLEKILSELDKKSKIYPEVYILVDELGKFIEYALTNNPKEETYVFQRLAEYINDPSKNIFWIGTLHQNIDRYAENVSNTDALEWEKVSGRFITLNFNEPPSTILKLISAKIDNSKIKSSVRSINAANKATENSKLLPDSYIKTAIDLKKECLPFDALTSFLTISLLQKYGQNERSIFTFLSYKDKYSLYNYNLNIYNPSELFEYSVQKLGHILFSSNNPDKLLWEASERALQRADSHKEVDSIHARVAIRTILLSNIFCREGSSFTEKNLQSYVSAVSGNNADGIVEQLVDKNIIQYLKHRGKMVFVEGTDVNIKSEIISASKILSTNINYTEEIIQRVELRPTLSRAHFIETGAPRFFHYALSSKNYTQKPISGFSNGICHVVLGENDTQKFTYSNDYPELYAHINDKSDLDSLMREILLYEVVLEKYQDDLVVKQLVANERDHVTNELNQRLREKCFSSEACWYSNDSH